MLKLTVAACYVDILYLYAFTAFVVGLEQALYTVDEDVLTGIVEVCVGILAGSANLECEIVTALVTTNGPKAGNTITNIEGKLHCQV